MKDYIIDAWTKLPHKTLQYQNTHIQNTLSATQPLTFSPEHIKYSKYISSHIPEEMYNGIQKLFSRNDREALKIPMGNQQPSAH